MKILLVDDERKSRMVLQSHLEAHFPDLSIAGHASCIEEAETLILQEKPGLVFLDIEMPEGNGFQLLERFEKREFQVIFTTSFNQYAIKAIRFSALDYLLKPIDAEELVTSVEKALAERNSPQASERYDVLKASIRQGLEKIAIPTMEGFSFLRVNDIEYCEASGNYTCLHLINGQSILVSRSLKHFDDLLSEEGFFRTHHSYLLNLRYINKFVKGSASVVMDSGREFMVSSRKKASFIDSLRKL